MLSIAVMYPFISAALALIMIILITIIGEKWGTRIGGLVGTIPSLLMVALLFISLSSGVQRASGSAVIVILEMAANITFITVFLLVLRRGLALSLVAGLTAWLFFTLGILYTGGFGLFGNILMYTAVLLIDLKILGKISISAAPVKIKYTPKELLFRGLFGGVIIGLAVYLAHIGGPVVGGIFSVFPVIFISTMVIYTLRHPVDIPRSMGKSMTMGSLNVISYSVAAALSFPMVGPWAGTIISILSSIVTAFLLLQFTSHLKLK